MKEIAEYLNDIILDNNAAVIPLNAPMYLNRAPIAAAINEIPAVFMRSYVSDPNPLERLAMHVLFHMAYLPADMNEAAKIITEYTKEKHNGNSSRR